MELLIASRPDFVIASCNTDSNIALMQTLENAGITVAYLMYLILSSILICLTMYYDNRQERSV